MKTRDCVSDMGGEWQQSHAPRGRQGPAWARTGQTTVHISSYHNPVPAPPRRPCPERLSGPSPVPRARPARVSSSSIALAHHASSPAQPPGPIPRCWPAAASIRRPWPPTPGSCATTRRASRWSRSIPATTRCPRPETPGAGTSARRTASSSISRHSGCSPATRRRCPPCPPTSARSLTAGRRRSSTTTTCPASCATNSGGATRWRWSRCACRTS